MSKNEPKYYASVSEWQNYLQKFSVKKVTKKLAESVKKKRELLAHPVKTAKKIRLEIPIQDSELGWQAKSAARSSNGRIQNWVGSNPSIYHVSKGDYDKFESGTGYKRGKGRFTYYSYAPRYISYVVLANGGKGLIYRCGFKGEIKSRLVRAPAGTIFTKDENGLLLKRLSDGMDYHPDCNDLSSKKFATIVRAKMANNFKNRLAAKKEERRAKLFEKFYQSDLNNTMVNLHDSRRAGNCIEGSLQFAEMRLNIPRQEILNGGYIFKVAASKLVKTGDERAIRAAKVAWQRETLVMI